MASGGRHDRRGAPDLQGTLNHWEENTLFAYIENSYVWNLGHTGRHDVNELRLYDFDAGYTFNIAEFSLKKDPSDRYPFGYGLVVTAGLDSQKNHALGIFRDTDDAFPFRNTEKFDLQEAYGSYKVPVGSGLTLKAGKFVTMHGYEVIESPSNLTTTLQYKIWRGLVGRLEYRHDEDADSKVFKVRAPGLVPTSRSQDTITLAFHYLFF